jgi:hypothetical protein
MKPMPSGAHPDDEAAPVDGDCRSDPDNGTRQKIRNRESHVVALPLLNEDLQSPPTAGAPPGRFSIFTGALFVLLEDRNNSGSGQQDCRNEYGPTPLLRGCSMTTRRGRRRPWALCRPIPRV